MAGSGGIEWRAGQRLTLTLTARTSSAVRGHTHYSISDKRKINDIKQERGGVG